MSTMNALLLLGSDLGDRENNLKTARNLIARDVGEVIKVGKIMETVPVEFSSDTMFLNQLVEIFTPWSPQNMLKLIKNIEKEMGRIYSKPLEGEKYISRIIDIDILRMEDLVYYSPNLVIPHNQINTRNFVKDMLRDY